MEFLYVFHYGSEWEDMIIILSKEEAIDQSVKYPKHRVEIFGKTETSGYRPTYDYYQNGELCKNTDK